MLEDFTSQTFSRHVGGTFRVRSGASEELEVELISALELGDAPKGGRPFSLVFRGPGEAPLDQRTYRMEHEEVGLFDIFLVPIGPDEKGPRYEAVFN